MREPLKFSGIMPANILPFKADLSVDEPAYRRHLRWLADTPGVTGIVANGHAAEVASLSREERTRTLAVALDEVAGACPIVADSTSSGRVHAMDSRNIPPSVAGSTRHRSFTIRCHARNTATSDTRWKRKLITRPPCRRWCARRRA